MTKITDLNDGGIVESNDEFVINRNGVDYKVLGSSLISSGGVTSVNGESGDVTIEIEDLDLDNVTNDAQLKREANDINSFSEKVTPVDDDILIIEDSEDSFSKKKVKMSSISTGPSNNSVGFTGAKSIGPSNSTISAYSELNLFDVASNTEYDVTNDVDSTSILGTGIGRGYTIPEDGYYRIMVTVGLQFSNGSQDNYINIKITNSQNESIKESFIPQTYTAGAFNTSETLIFEGFMSAGDQLRPRMLVGFPSGTCKFRTQSTGQFTQVNVTKM